MKLTLHEAIAILRPGQTDRCTAYFPRGRTKRQRTLADGLYLAQSDDSLLALAWHVGPVYARLARLATPGFWELTITNHAAPAA